MEVIHCHVRIISRAKGMSAVAVAAYCSGERLHNDYDDKTHNNAKRRDIVFKQILLPKNAPSSFYNRETLWNSVELIEKSFNAQMAREVQLSLPVELSERTEQINMVIEYAQKNFVANGMCCDVAIHDKGNGNPHAHILLTMRSLDNNGNWMMKQQKNYTLDSYGNKIYDPDTKQYKCSKSIKINDWDNRENVEKWRHEWATMCNREFERKQIDKKVTHDGYEMQGINCEPTKYLGPLVKALEKQGGVIERIIENEAIINRNRERLQQQKEREQNRSRRRELEMSR